MKRIVVNNFYELASIMYEDAVDGKSVYALMYFDEAVELMRELLLHRDISVGGLKLADFNYNGYDKEYFISLTGMTLDVEPAWSEANEHHDAGYLRYDADLIFADGDVHSSIMKDQNPESCYEIIWRCEHCDYCDYCNVYCYDDSEDYDIESHHISLSKLKQVLFRLFRKQ